MLNEQPLLLSAWPVARHYDHLSPQSKFLEATQKHLQNPRTPPSIAGSIDSPPGIVLGQLHFLASTTSEVESTHQWTANTWIPPSPSTPSVKSRMQQQVGLILRLSEQLVNWRLYGGGQGWWRGSNLSRDPFHPQNCPTELVVREHIVQQTLVRKEEKQLFYTVVKTLKKNCTGTVM